MKEKESYDRPRMKKKESYWLAAGNVYLSYVSSSSHGACTWLVAGNVLAALLSDPVLMPEIFKRLLTVSVLGFWV